MKAARRLLAAAFDVPEISASESEPFQGKERNAYNGLALVIVRSTGQPGAMTLKATSPGLKPAEVRIQGK